MPASSGRNSSLSSPGHCLLPNNSTDLEFYLLKHLQLNSVEKYNILAQFYNATYLGRINSFSLSTTIIPHCSLFQNYLESVSAWKDLFTQEDMRVLASPDHNHPWQLPNNRHVRATISTNNHFPAYSPTEISNITAISRSREEARPDWHAVFAA